MKSSYEINFTFRKQTTIHTFLAVSIILAAAIALVVIKWNEDPFYGCRYVAGFFLVVLCGKLLLRRMEIMKILAPDDADGTISKWQDLLERKRKQLHHTSLPRVVTGLLLFASFLYFLFTNPHTVVTGILFVCFLALVIDSLITHWLLMQDSMKLQDLKHSRQTDHSDIS